MSPILLDDFGDPLLAVKKLQEKEVSDSLALVRPGPKQSWAHSACRRAKLEHVINDPKVTAIEADIMMGMDSRGRVVPVMAHPTRRGHLPEWDVTFEEFLERCIADGRRHLKLDFKQLEAVEPCIKLVAKKLRWLRANGQNVYLNADILPGPNNRGQPGLPAHRFLPLCRKLCPQATLSLGWKCATVGLESGLTNQDVRDMLRVCKEYDVPGQSVVFCPSLRVASRSVPQLAQLLNELEGSQLLVWTGTGELPLFQGVREQLDLHFAQFGLQDRVGYDINVSQHATEFTAAFLALVAAVVYVIVKKAFRR